MQHYNTDFKRTYVIVHVKAQLDIMQHNNTKLLKSHKVCNV